MPFLSIENSIFALSFFIQVIGVIKCYHNRGRVVLLLNFCFHLFTSLPRFFKSLYTKVNIMLNGLQ